MALGGHPGSGSYDRHLDRPFIPRLDDFKGEFLRDSASLAVWFPAGVEGGAGEEDVFTQGSASEGSGATAQLMILFKARGAGLGRRAQGGQTGRVRSSGAQKPDFASSWHAFGPSTPGLTTAFQCPPCVGAGKGRRPG